MHFVTATLALGACLLSGVVAQGPQFTDWPAELHPGKPATVKWSGGSSGVSIPITNPLGSCLN